MRAELWHVPAAQRREASDQSSRQWIDDCSCGKWGEEAEYGGWSAGAKGEHSRQQSYARSKRRSSRPSRLAIPDQESHQAAGQQWCVEYFHLEDEHTTGREKASCTDGCEIETESSLRKHDKHDSRAENVYCTLCSTHVYRKKLETIACSTVKSTRGSDITSTCGTTCSYLVKIDNVCTTRDPATIERHD